MRSLIIEGLGTFYITLAIGVASLTPSTSTYLPFILFFNVFALSSIAISISGAHFNPILSIAAFIKKDLNLSDLIHYIISQLLGASLAFFPIFLLTPRVSVSAGNTYTSQIFAAEFLFSFLLSFSFVLVTSKLKSNSLHLIYYPITIAAVYACSSLLIGSISRSVMNPAILFSLNIIKLIPTSLLPAFISAHLLAALAGGFLGKYMVQEN